MLLLTMNEDDEKPDSVTILEASIDKMSNAMAFDGDVRAACRLAIAKWDGVKDVEQSKSGEAMGNIIDTLKKPVL